MKEYTEKLFIDLINVTNVRINQELNIRVKEHEFYCCVYCDALRTIGYSVIGKSDAIKKLKDNIFIFREVHNLKGTLKDALLKFGWKNTSSNIFEFDNDIILNQK